MVLAQGGQFLEVAASWLLWHPLGPGSLQKWFPSPFTFLLVHHSTGEGAELGHAQGQQSLQVTLPTYRPALPALLGGYCRVDTAELPPGESKSPG